MNLTEQTRFYRDKTKECVLTGDALGARKNAILYSKLMAQLQGMVSGYTERASISAERVSILYNAVKYPPTKPKMARKMMYPKLLFSFDICGLLFINKV